MARSRPASPPHPFQALYRRHYGFVWDAVRRFGVGPPLTDDAVQDTFVAAYRRFDEIAMPSARAWLYGVARRVASNYRRADHRAERKKSAIAIANASPSAQRPELLVELDRFIASLSVEDRELFVLSEIEGMSGPEAAHALALNVSTTYSRVQSLRKRFRARLGEATPREVRRAARGERPRATAQGWALLWTKLGVATKAAPIVGVGAVPKVAALALPNRGSGRGRGDARAAGEGRDGGRGGGGRRAWGRCARGDEGGVRSCGRRSGGCDRGRIGDAGRGRARVDVDGARAR